LKRIAVYPGTFDPVTFGHLDLVERGRKHVDTLIIAILRNEDKQAMFTVEERAAFLRDAVSAWTNVVVDDFDGLLVDYAKRTNASLILRGLRAVSDFEYELQMAMMNRRLAPDLETAFLMPNETFSYVSSRLVREVARLGGDIRGLVPPTVATALVKKFGSGQGHVRHP
jgi:pantetheine-phosphate adenylyltransferase